HVLPGPAAVGRAIDPLSVVSRITLSRRDDEVWILRVDADLVDLRRLLEADVRPGLARVGGLVHTVTARALHGVAGAGVDDVRIARRDLNGADAVHVRELTEDRRPRHAGAGGFPDPARRSADVEDAGLCGTEGASHGRDATAVERTDVAPLQ